MNARIRTVLADGLLVSFLTYFNGTIDRFHLTQVSPINCPSCNSCALAVDIAVCCMSHPTFPFFNTMLTRFQMRSAGAAVA